MNGVIRLGDPTSHGGKVISAASHATINGIAVARQGDACTCPVKGHDGCIIAEGDLRHRIDGIPVAYNGHKTSCGAVLISTAGTSGRV